MSRNKISRPLIDQYKQTYQALSKLEKTNIASECQLYLRELDTQAPEIQLDPLPSKPNKLEFNLVSNMKTSEISDYAIVCGDITKQLTIRSLFNFNYQTIPVVRRITILLDTLALFLNTDDKRVMSFRMMKETFEMYARKTCQNLAVQGTYVPFRILADFQ